MALALQYRPHRGAGWLEGFTLNVSRSGALVHPAGAHGPLPAGLLDFVLSLPRCGIVPSPRIRGTGRVVRIATGRIPTFALAIERYWFVKPGEQVPLVAVGL